MFDIRYWLSTIMSCAGTVSVTLHSLHSSLTKPCVLAMSKLAAPVGIGEERPIHHGPLISRGIPWAGVRGGREFCIGFAGFCQPDRAPDRQKPDRLHPCRTRDDALQLVSVWCSHTAASFVVFASRSPFFSNSQTFAH